MTTKADYLAAVRLRMNDADGTRWEDDELNAYLSDAARDYSKYFPRKREQEFTADGTSDRYDVPTDLIDDQVLAVTKTDAVTDRSEMIPNKGLRRRNSDRWWEVVDQEIVLGWIPNEGDTLLVRYNAIHTMPDTGASSVPFEDEDLIYAYVMAVAWQRIGGNDAGLSRWTEDQKRDDSPIIPHYVRLWDRYQRLIAQKQQTPRFYKRVRTQGTWRS